METAKLVTDGPSQTVYLPEAIHFPGDHVFVKRVGNAVVLLPCDDSWQPLRESLFEFTADFMAQRDQPPQSSREHAFE